MSWFPPQEIGPAYVKLRQFAESLEFEDFCFEAAVCDGNILQLRCHWRDCHVAISIGPQHFGDEKMLMFGARQAVMHIVTGALDEKMRAAAPVLS